MMRLVRQDPLRKKIILPKRPDVVDKSYTNVFWPGDADPESSELTTHLGKLAC